ncbi:BTAD domain-containing putative transcriptional regulator [Streptomyces zhihengii]|uniref:BTAD domain-containing putative transcriptional regulator n=1 Tax=Streptomyces zhihengii TaxID=1818004 RepID=UPI003556BE81
MALRRRAGARPPRRTGTRTGRAGGGVPAARGVPPAAHAGALHRTGRQAEALGVYRALHRTLVGELGVDPGPAVREAHAEVLRGPFGALRPPVPRADHRFADGA